VAANKARDGDVNVHGTSPHQLIESIDEPGTPMSPVGLQERAVLHRRDSSSVATPAKSQRQKPTRDENGTIWPGKAHRVGKPPRLPEGNPPPIESKLGERDDSLPQSFRKRLAPRKDDHPCIYLRGPEDAGKGCYECLGSSDRSAPDDEG
jgi:hypothetical protein